MWWKLLAGLLLIAVLPLIGVLIMPNHPLSQVADEADQLHLKLIAESIYEYHAAKGAWPTQADDLLQTSLTVKATHDIDSVRNGPYVVLWAKDFDSEPKKNAGRLLVYTRGGPLRRGWVWACWGDFRTEYIEGGRFDAILQAGKN